MTVGEQGVGEQEKRRTGVLHAQGEREEREE